jgi:AraC-like DNA-binding protein
LLGFAPKTLTHKFKRLHLSQPNEVIKDRIILEAKRLLTYTQMSAKKLPIIWGMMTLPILIVFLLRK